MFGYVRAIEDFLTVREDRLYRGAYCGLCKEMGRCTGGCSRLTLSYDIVFLYLVRCAILENTPNLKGGRCLLHPFRKKQIVQSDSQLKYAAGVSALLTYGKVCDDLADEKGLKRFLKLIIKPFSRRWKRRAKLDELYKAIEEKLTELSRIESQCQTSVDAPADVFGRLLGDVFAFGIAGDKAKLAREIGFRTGRWIYAVDALDDIKEDKQNGSYNPFLLLYGGEISDEQLKFIEMSMKYDLTALASAIDLIEECEAVKIIKNIVYLGMPQAVTRVIKGDKGE